jgi:dihydroanticapsin dehydrogenase
MRFKDRVVIVTAGSTGIGKAISTLFANEGASVIIANRNKSEGEKVVAEINGQNGKGFYVQTDISRQDQVANLFREVERRFGRLDVLVNNAASFLLRSVDATAEEWSQILSVNVIGTALCSQYAAQMMKSRKCGSIVNISSISGVIAQSNQMTYNATKAAIMAMTRCMALDLSQYNIRVNCVAPGYVLTPQVEKDIKLNDLTVEQAQVEWGGRHILKRMADPREIAPAVLFLASDQEASFITGTILMVDGGYTAI